MAHKIIAVFSHTIDEVDNLIAPYCISACRGCKPPISEHLWPWYDTEALYDGYIIKESHIAYESHILVQAFITAEGRMFARDELCWRCSSSRTGNNLFCFILADYLKKATTAGMYISIVDCHQ